MTVLFTIGFMKCFGLFMVEYIRVFRANTTMTSAIFGMQFGVNSITAWLVLTFGLTKWSARQLVISGGILFCVAYFVGSFAPSINFLIFANGILLGIATGLCFGPSCVILGDYFVRWQGLATGLTLSGASVGGLVLPFLIHYLFREYGLRGTLLISGGIVFNICVMGSLMKPFKTNTHRTSTYLSNGDDDVNLFTDEEAVNVRLTQSDGELNTIGTNSQEIINTNATVSKQKSSLQIQLSISDGSLQNSSPVSLNAILDSLSRSTLFSVASTGDIARASMASVSNKQHDSNGKIIKNQSTPTQSRISSLYKKMVLLKNKLFILLIISCLMITPGSVLTAIFVPPHAEDLGIEDEKLPILASVLGAADLTGRVICSLLSDTGWVKSHNLMSISAMISGATCLLSSFYNEFWSMCIFSALYGLFGGIYMSIFIKVLIDFLEVENLAFGLGVISIVQGVSIAAAVPILGYIRDSTGSYLQSFYTVGSLFVIGGAILFMEPIARRWDNSQTGLLPRHRKPSKQENSVLFQDAKTGGNLYKNNS